jgi:antiphage defense system Thoeris ThsB-like protein
MDNWILSLLTALGEKPDKSLGSLLSTPSTDPLPPRSPLAGLSAFSSFSPESPLALSSLLNSPAPDPIPIQPPPAGLSALFPQSESPFGWDNTLSAKPPTPSPLASLVCYTPPAPRLPTTRLGEIKPALVALPEVKRKVYFAFDFDDVIRVNNVRQVGKIGPREERNRTFYDRSIWESRNIKTDEGLKNLMREAVRHSSAVCALIGTNTWRSRWAKYEIARAIIDERGLLAVHLNGINHHVRHAPDRRGINPLHVMGVYHSPNGNYYLYEKHPAVTNEAAAELGWEWRPYEDYTDPVPLPRYIPRIDFGYVMPLSVYAGEYDMKADDGFKNIGAWIDAAAAKVGY